MSKWRRVESFFKFYSKGITPQYVEDSSIIVLNQKCIRNNKIDYAFSQYTDDSVSIKDKAFIEEGDILINSTGQGTAGRCAFVRNLPPNKKVVIDSHILRLKGNSYYESQCLAYSLYSIESLLQTFMDGSTGQGEFDKVRLFNMLSSIPNNPDIQKNIAKVLSSLDSKIELNNRINAELEAMAKTLYDYWFVQFDFPNAEDKPYKSSGGKMVWNKELKREMPEEWKVGELKDIINITTGKLDSNAEIINAKYPFYTCATEPTTTDTYAYDDTVILIAGNNASGNFHINRYKGKFNAYQRTYIVTANDLIDLEYIYQVLNIETKLLKTQGKGSQTKFLTIGMLTGIKVIRNKELMKLFHEKVNPMYEKQEVIRKENQQLSFLRDWLLPMLMNGQVKVGEVSYREAIVEELMAAEVTPTYILPAQSNIPDNKRGFAKQVLGGKIVKVFMSDKNFTHIKFQKLQYLAEQIIEEDLDWNYYRQMAGPYDNKFMHSVFNRLEKNSWFRIRGDKYHPLGKVNDIDKYYQNYFGDKSEKLNNLFGLLQKGTEKFCEAIATIYAVWNNHIILKQEFNKEHVKTDFFDWSNRKTVVFTEDEFEKALVWMQKHDIVPTGFGGLIKEKK